MKKMPKKYLAHAEQYLDVIDAIREAKDSNRRDMPLTLSLDRFDDDPFGLYTCLWYAHGEHVTVVFSPRSGGAPIDS